MLFYSRNSFTLSGVMSLQDNLSRAADVCARNRRGEYKRFQKYHDFFGMDSENVVTFLENHRNLYKINYEYSDFRSRGVVSLSCL